MPYIRLSVLYFAYYAIFGVLIPYLGRYLNHYGYNFQQIGIAMACLTGINMLAPFVLARISDVLGVRLPLARAAALLMILAAWLFEPQIGFGRVILSVLLIGSGLSMVLPQLEAVTLDYLGENKHRYGFIRSWGAVGFTSIVWTVGPIMDEYGIQWYRYLLMATVVALFAFMFLLKDPEYHSYGETGVDIKGNGLEHFKEMFVVVLFVVYLINQTALAPYNSFADLYWQSWGHSSSSIGVLLAVAPIAETALTFLIPIVLFRFGYFKILCLALLLSVIRWFVMASVPGNFAAMAAVQLIHAFSFGAMHVTAMFLIGQVFYRHQRGMGQSLYVCLVSGLGLVLGNVYGGHFWNGGEGARFVFFSSSAMCLIALVLAVLYMRPQKLLALSAARTSQNTAV
ncbi:MFS transporter [Gynuella sp.]|uniref:MFS transporter n=1 Tax=Gynuella sp. TaxID=2969146 RepID=UPI003D0AD687